MRTLVALGSVDAKRHLQAVVRAKRGSTKSVLLLLGSRVEQAFDAFDAHLDARTLEGLSPMSLLDDQKRSLILCYKTKSKARDALFEEVERAMYGGAQSFCVYCDSVEKLTWDHYAPKDLYAEFAVHPRNLLRACYPCNVNKSDKYLNGANRRCVLHPGSDILPDVPCLKVSINIRSGTVIPTYGIDATSLTPAETNALVSHYTELKLFKAFQDRAIDRIAEVVNNVCRRGNRVDDLSLRQELREAAESFQESHHKNDWRTALFRALASDAPFITFCCS